MMLLNYTVDVTGAAEGWEAGMDGTRYLTVAQVGERLQVHPETVRRWLRDGRLRGHFLSRKGGYRVAESELRRFLDQNTKRDAAAAEGGGR